jgi:hypothetical protein
MSLVRLHLFVAIVLVASALAACGGAPRPQLKVLGMEHSERVREGRQIKLFVEVVNYARRPMKLQRLQYVFGPTGSSDGARGEVQLSRTVDGGSAVVVEVAILVGPGFVASGDLELRGRLFAEQDQVLRAYPVLAGVSDEDLAATRIGDPDGGWADDPEPLDDDELDSADGF